MDVVQHYHSHAYLNSHCTAARAYTSFSYKTYIDFVQLGEQGALMATWDLKARHHHVILVADLWHLLAFHMDLQLHVLCCLPIGRSQAPNEFTRVMHGAYVWTGSSGHALTAMVDDDATVHPT